MADASRTQVTCGTQAPPTCSTSKKARGTPGTRPPRRILPDSLISPLWSPFQVLSRHSLFAHYHSPQGSDMLARSENNGPVRPHSQDELPLVGQQSLGIESSTRSLLLLPSSQKGLLKFLFSCSGRITRTGPNRFVFLLLVVVFAILLIKWLLVSVDDDGASLSNAISPQVGEPLHISTNISTHS